MHDELYRRKATLADCASSLVTDLRILFGRRCLQSGGGCLVYLSDGYVPFFRVSFSPSLLERDIKRRQFFEPVVKTCQ